MIGRSAAGRHSATRGVPPLTGDHFQFDARDDSPEPAREIDVPLRAARAQHDVSQTDESLLSSGRGVVVGMLVIGLLAGFVGGFVTGQRMAPPPPASAADVPGSVQPSPPPEPPAAIAEPVVVDDAAATPTGGNQAVSPNDPAPRDANRRAPAAPVPPAASSAPAAAAPVRPPASSAPPAAARVEPPRAPAPVQPAMLDVVSRPAGATVFLDDERVGVTPLTINDVTPGSRRVRLELAGHGPWSTSVDVKAGAHVRIGASLE